METILYVQKKKKKSERLDLRVKPSTLTILELLKNAENYNSVSQSCTFVDESVSDMLEFGLKLLAAKYLKHEAYQVIYPEVEKNYTGLYGNDIVTIHDHMQSFKDKIYTTD